ncbi:hypothetical protein FYK55_13460 [Roseiconus nitratireducens]|uniref:Uncharacterized protein n=1 Tax=Roseiconus nitratireducens TaxID=2605748 RepID=A0A5M6D7A9_9BACT|nr:hypothetical protein [Roseiconus nitratireducens]KAA5542546.1 hypothetical protein FYK55_13460 [Roseiconus nitratireducens]
MNPNRPAGGVRGGSAPPSVSARRIGNQPPLANRFASRFAKLVFAEPLFVAKRLVLVLATTILLSGCGGDSADTSRTATIGEQASGNDSDTLAPAEIVSQFLDRVRRGGKDASANDLLTKLAQQEMTRIGRPLQFPGSPDTRFEVLQAYPVPNQEDAVWVHTFLSEPVEPGDLVRYEVVWTLRRETEGWRISGFTIDQGQDQPPMEIDFEDGNQMETKLTEALEDTDSKSR